jgi:hypothetical protein
VNEIACDASEIVPQGQNQGLELLRSQ